MEFCCRLLQVFKSVAFFLVGCHHILQQKLFLNTSDSFRLSLYFFSDLLTRLKILTLFAEGSIPEEGNLVSNHLHHHAFNTCLPLDEELVAFDLLITGQWMLVSNTLFQARDQFKYNWLISFAMQT